MSRHSEFADAIESGKLEEVARLIAEQPDLVNHPDWTPPPLHCSVLWDQPEIAEYLLDHGADIELLDPDRSTTPLRYAIVYNRPRLIQLLIARGANAQAITDGGTTAVELAEAAAAGEFDEFDELPSREEYAPVVILLKRLLTHD